MPLEDSSSAFADPSREGAAPPEHDLEGHIIEEDAVFVNRLGRYQGEVEICSAR